LLRFFLPPGGQLQRKVEAPNTALDVSLEKT